MEKGDFEALENDWLARLDQSPDDLDYFVGVARALGGNGQEGRARTLLEMLDDQLKEGRWRTRLKLLQRAGNLMLQPEKLHRALVTTLEKIYGERALFKPLSEAVGLHRAPGDLPKTWEKVERLEGLLAFDIGTVVSMDGKGVGRIADANLGLESFKVDFEKHKGLTVGFKAAAKLLRPLAPQHVLRRKLEEPDTLKALVTKDPPELLRIVLQSYDRALTAGEIREILAGIVAESQWTSWWGAARKHPQVVAGGAGRQTYGWAESAGDAHTAVWKTFTRAEPRKKMDLLRREGARDPELRARMAEKLLEEGETASATDPGLAFEIWFALEKSGGAPEDVDWGPEALMDGNSKELARLFAGVEDRQLRERAYAMVRERRDDWPAIYRDTLGRETDPRALDILADGLAQGEPRELERFIDGLLAQPHRNPAAFTWLAERAANDEALRARNPLRMLQQILGSMSRDEFAPYRLRLIALAESGNTLPRLLGHLTEDQAAQAEDAVHRASNLEPYQREQLVNALQLRFQALRKENAEQAAFYATPESIDAKRAELQQILSVDIPANRKAIEEARAMGDLRENFEYKSARQRHEYLNARAASLNAELQRVRPLDPTGMDTSEVRIGTRLRLTGPGGERTMTILGPWESKPEEDIISYESDLAKELLGKPVGGSVRLSGESWSVAEIQPYR